MKLCHETVTLYNARFDKDADCTVYIPTVLSGVHSYSTMKSTVDSNGLKSANTTTFRIPADVDAGGKKYADPQSYTTADNVNGLFTLNEGDFIIPGHHVLNDPTPSFLHRIHGCVTILGVTDNRNAPRAQHWKVVGT